MIYIKIILFLLYFFFISQVSIIFHVAASVRFDEEIKIATTVNIIATNVILNIAKRMPNLKVISFCNNKFYKQDNWKELINFYEF